MTREREKPKFPYVEFKKIKKLTHKDDPNGTESPEHWFLNVSGTHNNISSLGNFLKGSDRSVLVGYGNLNSKHAEIKDFIDGHTGHGVDPRLLTDEPEKVLAKRVKDEQAKRA